jgi:hypothetical protein
MNVVIYNNSDSSISISKGTATTLRLAGTTKTDATRSLQGRGIATILCVATSEYVISGAGVL